MVGTHWQREIWKERERWERGRYGVNSCCWDTPQRQTFLCLCQTNSNNCGNSNEQTTTKRAKAHKLRKQTHKCSQSSWGSAVAELAAAAQVVGFLTAATTNALPVIMAAVVVAAALPLCMLCASACVCVCVCLGVVCVYVCSLAWFQRRQHFAVYLHRLLLHYFICINCQRMQPPTHTRTHIHTIQMKCVRQMSVIKCTDLFSLSHSPTPPLSLCQRWLSCCNLCRNFAVHKKMSKFLKICECFEVCKWEWDRVCVC